jgi:hypothetical protein
MLRDLYNYLYHQETTGGLPLKATGIVVAIALIVSHAWAWLKRREAQAFLQSFPRSYPWGVVLLSLGYAWAMLALSYMDMGEFFYLRDKMCLIVSAFFVGMLVYVREFLAVRALGCLLLLVAGLVLEAAFLKPQISRLLMPSLAYVWIIAGMFFVGMPYTMRDAVNWVTAKPSRWNVATLAGMSYGFIMLLVALADW